MQSRKLIHWFKTNLSDILATALIAAVCVFVAYKNYVPGTWLIGWDNLMPELNFKLNIMRSASAVWQEYQGVGLLGGMAHASDLSRQLILYFASAFLPPHFLRYLWTFAMLTMGPIGMYFLVGKGLFIATEEDRFIKPVKSFAGLSAAIFYLFNLATVQNFFTPFETFTAFFGFLPWLIFAAIGYLYRGGFKRLLTFAFLSVLATGAFYVQTLFAVYAIFLAVLCLEIIVRLKKTGLGRVFKLALVVFLMNSFWLAPAAYFTYKGGSIPANSHVNSIATPETQYLNLARSGFSDIATLKGYWFDYYDWSGNKFDYLFKDWISHQSDSNVMGAEYALFIFAAAGILFSVFRKNTRFGVSFLVLLGIAYFMISGGQLKNIPLFSEIFRNSYTKWSTAMSFIYAVGLGYFLYDFATLTKHRLKVGIAFAAAVVFIGFSVFSVMPVTEGKLISDSMRLNLPGDYLETIKYFDGVDPTARIATFPLTDYLGWKFNDWGYRGSGFVWYGISQPILDRAFDVWSPQNESFYNEVVIAVNAADPEQLKFVLEKYQVTYILWDGSIFQPGSPDSNTIFSRQKSFLENSGFLTKEAEFGKVAIYKFGDIKADNFVGVPQTDYSASYYRTGLIAEPEVKETFPTNQGYPEAKNCDLKLKGSVKRERNADGNLYSAFNGGIACDYFYYPGLDYSKAYKLHVKGKNIKGRSLKIFLFNVKNRQVELMELMPQGEFDRYYTIYPVSNVPETGMGYTVTVETRAFGNINSENIINQIEFLPVEVYKNTSPEVQNNLSINSVKKYGTFAYAIELNGNGILELGQGYDQGWIAITRDINEIKVLPHIKLNSWSNGWKVGEGKVYVIYIPQLLQFAGLITALTTLFYLKLLKNSHN